MLSNIILDIYCFLRFTIYVNVVDEPAFMYTVECFEQYVSDVISKIGHSDRHGFGTVRSDLLPSSNVACRFRTSFFSARRRKCQKYFVYMNFETQHGKALQTRSVFSLSGCETAASAPASRREKLKTSVEHAFVLTQSSIFIDTDRRLSARTI